MREVIRCEGVSKNFDSVTAVSSASLSVGAGEIVSILGPSGCGKSTMLRLIAGLERVDAGSIVIDGATVSSNEVHLPTERRRVGMVFQDYALFPHLTVAANVAFGLDRIPRAERRERVAEILELVGLSALGHRYPHELSGGQQQRVAVGRTLAPRPVAVLLDEPFSNLDAGMRAEVRTEIGDILRSRGVATMIVTHDREEAFSMSHRVAVMNLGAIEQVDNPRAMYRTPLTPLVAGMTGTSDFLEGTITDGRAVTAAGALAWTSGSVDLGEGDVVRVLVRPDDFWVVPNPEGASKVTFQDYRGDSVIVGVSFTSGETVRCRQGPYSDLTVGSRVRLFPSRSVPFMVFPVGRQGADVDAHTGLDVADQQN